MASLIDEDKALFNTISNLAHHFRNWEVGKKLDLPQDGVQPYKTGYKNLITATKEGRSGGQHARAVWVTNEDNISPPILAFFGREISLSDALPVGLRDTPGSSIWENTKLLGKNELGVIISNPIVDTSTTKYITGFGLGGAFAQRAAQEIFQGSVPSFNARTYHVVTFQAPGIGMLKEYFSLKTGTLKGIDHHIAGGDILSLFGNKHLSTRPFHYVPSKTNFFLHIPKNWKTGLVEA